MGTRPSWWRATPTTRWPRSARAMRPTTLRKAPSRGSARASRRCSRTSRSSARRLTRRRSPTASWTMRRRAARSAQRSRASTTTAGSRTCACAWTWTRMQPGCSTTRPWPCARADAEDGAAYVETALAYLGNGCNASRTAEALFIHRNTLAYRLKRIKALSGIDLENPAAAGTDLLRVHLELPPARYRGGGRGRQGAKAGKRLPAPTLDGRSRNGGSERARHRPRPGGRGRPDWQTCWSTGMTDSPFGARAYSTRGGISSNWRRTTKPSVASSLSSLTQARHRSRRPSRRAARYSAAAQSESTHRMRDFHLPPNTSKPYSSGHRISFSSLRRLRRAAPSSPPRPTARPPSATAPWTARCEPCRAALH